MRDMAVGIIRRYDVKTPGPATTVRNLSGGNLQKLILGREFEDDPLVLVVAQPTRGLDVGAIETVHSYLRGATARGVAILLMSEDLDEIRALADRILVVYEGEIVGELHAGAASIEELGYLMAGGQRVKLERRLAQPWWLSVAVPVGSLVVAFAVMRMVLKLTGHSPWETYRKIVEAGFTGSGALSATLISATPILFTGLAAAVAFRMQLFNIGAEDSSTWSRRSVVDCAPARRPGRDVDAAVSDRDVRRCGRARSAVGADPGGAAGVRADERDHHVADAQLRGGPAPHVPHLRQLVVLARHVDPAGWAPAGEADVRGFRLVDVRDFGRRAARLSHRDPRRGRGLVLYSRMRFGFEVGVIADSLRAARYAGMRTRRKILAVMALSGAIAGIGGASQIGDFTHTLDGSPTGLQAAAFGYTGIVVAALARYNPFAVCLVAVLIGGLLNAGYTLQGPDFPSGLVGVMQGIILFCALGAELLLRYRVRIPWLRAGKPIAEAGV